MKQVLGDFFLLITWRPCSVNISLHRLKVWLLLCLQGHDRLWRPEGVRTQTEAASMAWTEPRPDPEPEPKLTLHNFRTHITLPSAVLQIQPPLLLRLFLLLAAFADLGAAGPARPPLLSGQPFIIFWGIPDSSCSGRPDPGSFGMEREGRVAVFYEDTLGNYPYLVDKDTPVNGGLPQHTRLDSHLQKTQQDLEAALPAPRYLGLGILRWAEWIPQWSRNRDRKAMYVEASRKLLKTFFPNWTPEEVEKWSQVMQVQAKRDQKRRVMEREDKIRIQEIKKKTDKRSWKGRKGG